MFKAYKYYWQNAFKYKARSTRADFWWPVLVTTIIFLILTLLIVMAVGSAVTNLLDGYGNAGGFAMVLMILTGIFAIANIFPSIAISVRRFRDAGLSGWAVLAFWLISIVLSSGDNSFLVSLSFVLDVIELVLCCLPSGYISQHGWWSPNYTDDVKIPSLQNND